MSETALFSPPAESSGGTGAPSEPPVRRIRRRPMTPAERWVLVAMVVAACVMGALSAAEPTGHAVIDATYRALFVGTMALAASRSRRWALVIGSAVTAVASVGVGLFFAVAALVMTVVLVIRQLRNRAYGACIGAFVGMACLRLSVDWFLGAEALVGAVAAVPILWSGYRVSARTTRRVVRWTLGGACAVGAAAVVMAGLQALNYTSEVNDAVNATTRGVRAVRGGETSEAAELFVAASDGFAAVADDADSWYWFPTKLIPVLSQNLATVPAVARAGETLTDTAASTAGKIDYRLLRREGGGVDMARLEEYSEPVLDVAQQLAEVADDVDDLRTPWLLGPIEDRLDEFDAKVSDLRREADLAALVVRYGPPVFGGSGLRHYLVLLGNPAEARDLGGHIGNLVELSVDNGVISLDDVTVPRDLSQSFLDEKLADSGLAPPSMLDMRPATFPQNWGTAVDFPTDARVAARLYAAKAGHPIDGVLYADPFSLAQLLSITGPVEVPELKRKITSQNAVEFLTIDQYRDFPTQDQANDALTGFVRTLFDRLTTTTLPAPATLGERFGPLVKEGRFRFMSLHEEDAALTGPLGLAVPFDPVEGSDMLAVITRNANPSKIDAFLHRSTDAQISWDPDSGAVRTVVTVTLRNDAPASGLPRYVIGNEQGQPDGTNVTDLAVVTPFEATRATVDGVDALLRPLRDDGVWRHTVRVVVPPGATRTVRFELEGDLEAGDSYRLRYSGQPLVNQGPVSLEVTATDPRARMIDGRGVDVQGPSATAALTDVGRVDLSLRVRR